jgi:hypothetical protein
MKAVILLRELFKKGKIKTNKHTYEIQISDENIVVIMDSSVIAVTLWGLFNMTENIENAEITEIINAKKENPEYYYNSEIKEYIEEENYKDPLVYRNLEAKD